MTRRDNSDNEKLDRRELGDKSLPAKDHLEHSDDAKHARHASGQEHRDAVNQNKDMHSGTAGGQGQSIEVVVRDSHGNEKVAASRKTGGSEKDILHGESRSKSITREELQKAASTGDITAAKLAERMKTAKSHEDLAAVQKEADRLFGRGAFAKNLEGGKHDNEHHSEQPTVKKEKSNSHVRKQNVDTGILEAIKKDGTISREKRQLAEHLQEMRSTTKKLGHSTNSIDDFAQKELSREIEAKHMISQSPDLKEQILRGIVRMGVENLKVHVGIAHGGVNFVVNTLAGLGNAVRVAGAAAYEGIPIGTLCPDLYPDKEATKMLHHAVETTAVAGRLLLQLQTTFNPTSPLYGIEFDPRGAEMTRTVVKSVPKKIGDELNRLAHADTEEKAAVATEAVLNIATLVETGGLGAAAKVGELKNVSTVAKIAEQSAALAEVSQVAKVASTAESIEHLNPAASVVKAVTHSLETQSKSISLIASRRPSLQPLAKKFDECVNQVGMAVKEQQQLRLRVAEEHIPTERPMAPEGMVARGKGENKLPNDRNPPESKPGEKSFSEGSKRELSKEEIESRKLQAGTRMYHEVHADTAAKRPIEQAHTEDLIESKKAELKATQGKFDRLRRTDLGDERNPYNWRARGERFSDDVVRQTTKDSCVSAVGEMISDGAVSEEFLEKVLLKNGNYNLLAEALGEGWISKRLGSLSNHPGNGPWMAELLENAWTELSKSLHAVAVDGFSVADDVVYIRDPWEGTKYDMSIEDFERIWTGKSVFRTVAK